MLIVAGIVDLNRSDVKHYAIKEVIYHEKYDPSNSWLNDIALIKVNYLINIMFNLQTVSSTISSFLIVGAHFAS